MDNVTGSTTASAMLTANNATNTATRNYNLYLDIKNNGFTYTVDENTPELILTITGPDDQPLEKLAGYEYVTVDGVSGFDITEASNAILIADNYEITASPEITQTWNITVTFINLDSDQNKNTGKTFAADVHVSFLSAFTKTRRKARSLQGGDIRRICLIRGILLPDVFLNPFQRSSATACCKV